ncbi:MAG: mechanosensitive ion channel [Melioribacteraceae bacterium]|nr:mechanosensitive ion channel [Melioribacteraceae bacterium]MDD3558332.1 mechanosensitive ion channel [Melioribacteraceae bacterium]
MNTTDLKENINDILHYSLFEVNNTPISLLSVLIFIGIIVGFIVLSKIIRYRLLKVLLKRTGMDKGLQFTLGKITNYTLLFIGVLIAFQFIGIDLSGLAVVLGFLSVGIGFGLQNITSNFISGIILLFERPIKVGDRITVNDIQGDVTDITIRATTIRSVDNISIIVPNSEFISGTVINWSHGDLKLRVNINVGVSYSSDLELVLRSLYEVAEENKDVLKEPKPVVHFNEFGDSSWSLTLRVWVSDPKLHLAVKSAINVAIVKKFRENKIEIPFPQRDLHVRSGKLPVLVENKSE